MIKTLAMKITPETYSIAVACLPDGFAHIKKKFVMGGYLVINALPLPDSLDANGLVVDDEPEDFDPEDPQYSPRPRTNLNFPPVGYRRRYVRNSGVLTLGNFWVSKKMFKKEFEIDWVTAQEAAMNGNGFFEVDRK